MVAGLNSLVILLVTARDVAADDSPLSQLRQAIFFGYDKNVIPQEVWSANIHQTEKCSKCMGICQFFDASESNEKCLCFDAT